MMYAPIIGVIAISVLSLALPVDSAKTSRLVDVAAFGAMPNDDKDDTAAVQAALEECKKGSPVTLRFPRGRYKLTNTGKGPLIALNGIDDLTIDGNDSELIIDGPTTVFSFGSCRKVIVRNLKIDWARPPFSQGKVIAAEGNHFDVEVFPEYPVSAGMSVGALMDVDPRTKLYKRHGLDLYNCVTSTELLGPQVLRVNLNHQTTIRPGVWVVLRHYVYGHAAFYCERCSDIKVENVTVYTVPGMGFIGKHCRNIALEKFDVVPRPNTGRLMSATADALHLSGNTGRLTIRNCEFTGMGDDAANIKMGLFLAVRERVDDRTVLASHNLQILDPPEPGNVMEFSRPDVMVPYAKARVSKCEVLSKDGLQRIEFTRPLPTEVAIDDMLANASRTAKVRISNCVVRNNRARGFLIQNRDVVVDGCRFENCTSGGVWVVMETTYFCEAGGSRDVFVKNCTFDNCNYGGPIGECVLGAYAVLRGNKRPPQPRLHSSIVFENNVIRRSDNAGICIMGVDGLVLRGNTIEWACENPTWPEGKSAIYIMSSRNVVLEKNTVNPKLQGKDLNRVVNYGPGCDTATFTIRGNEGF